MSLSLKFKVGHERSRGIRHLCKFSNVNNSPHTLRSCCFEKETRKQQMSVKNRLNHISQEYRFDALLRRKTVSDTERESVREREIKKSEQRRQRDKEYIFGFCNRKGSLLHHSSMILKE